MAEYQIIEYVVRTRAETLKWLNETCEAQGLEYVEGFDAASIVASVKGGETRIPILFRKVPARANDFGGGTFNIHQHFSDTDPGRIMRSFKEAIEKGIASRTMTPPAPLPPEPKNAGDTVVNAVELDELRAARASLEMMLHELGLPKNVDVFKMRDHLRDLRSTRSQFDRIVELLDLRTPVLPGEPVAQVRELVELCKSVATTLSAHEGDTSIDITGQLRELVELRETICREAGIDPAAHGEMSGAKALAKAIKGMREALKSRGEVLERIKAALALGALVPWGEVFDEIARLRDLAEKFHSIKHTLDV